MQKALIVWGGWDGHEPQQVGEVCATILREHDYDVEIIDSLDSFSDVDALSSEQYYLHVDPVF